MTHAVVGLGLQAIEFAFTCLWSVSEVAALTVRERLPDTGALALAADIEQRGFYVDVDPAAPPRLRGFDRSGGEPRMLVAPSPYRYVGERGAPRDRVVARFDPARGRSRRLVVVLHCYGVPYPALIGRLFGTDALRDHETDVAYAIMHHHQRGTYPLWPGSGLTSMRPATMVENVRAAVASARALVHGLRAARDYERVEVIGYSIGGQLAMHLANSEELDRVLLYCPVVSIERTARELGLMRVLHAPFTRVARVLDPGYDLDLLELASPLRYALKTPAERIELVMQKFDAMTPPSQIQALRDAHPSVRVHEFGGSHVLPVGWSKLRELVRGS